MIFFKKIHPKVLAFLIIVYLLFILTGCPSTLPTKTTKIIEETAEKLIEETTTQEQTTQEPKEETEQETEITIEQETAEEGIEETTITSTNEEANMGMLAYINDGNIYIKDLPNGQVKQLTTDGKNHNPSFSPSGQWIACYKNDKINLIQISSGETRVIKTNEVVEFFWSPVSDTIAYITWPGSLLVASSPEWHEHELVPNIDGREGTAVNDITWSPDGEWIAYTQDKCIKKEPSPGFYYSLCKIRKDGSEKTELCGSNLLLGVPPPLPDNYYASIVATWSLDGEYIIFWSALTASILADSTSLMVIPSNGGNPSKLVEHMLIYSDFLDNSSNGKLLAITEGAYRFTWLQKHIVIVDISSGSRSIITDKNISALYPKWSPDGKQIAYVAAPDIGPITMDSDIVKAGMAKRRIRVVNISNMKKLQFKQLTNDQAYRDEFPIWSRDGKYILFTRIDTEDRSSLWLISEVGGEPQQVVKELTLSLEWPRFYGHTWWNDCFDWWQGDVITTQK